MSVDRSADDQTILAATIYAEARGETERGQLWVGWVIKNRARKNRSYWGGSKIKQVCLHPYQFECWHGKSSIPIYEPNAWQTAVRIADAVLNGGCDPTNGCDHFNNPAKEGYPSWTNNVQLIETIGNHNFYRGP